MKITKFSFILFLFVFLSNGLIEAQKILNGRILEKNSLLPVCCCNVIAKSNSGSIISFGGTNDAGGYKIMLPDSLNSIIIEITDLRYKNYRKEHDLDELTDSFPDILLFEDTLGLSTIVVNSERPYEILGDTIRFNAQHYARGGEAVLNDLLQKIPGVEVDKSGKITVGGKEVKKIMIEGDDFFGDRYRTLSSSLPSDVVEKIDVIQNYFENPLLRGKEGSDDIALNIGLSDKAKRRVFGTVEGLISEEPAERFDGKVTTMNFRKKRKFFGVFRANSIGSTANYTALTNDSKDSFLGLRIGSNKPVRSLDNPGNTYLPSDVTRNNREKTGEISWIEKIDRFTKATIQLKGLRDNISRLRINNDKYTLIDPPVEITENRTFTTTPAIGVATLKIERKANENERLFTDTRLFTNAETMESGVEINQGSKNLELVENSDVGFFQKVEYTKRQQDSSLFLVNVEGLINDYTQQYDADNSPLLRDFGDIAEGELHQRTKGEERSVKGALTYLKRWDESTMSVSSQNFYQKQIFKNRITAEGIQRDSIGSFEQDDLVNRERSYNRIFISYAQMIGRLRLNVGLGGQRNHLYYTAPGEDVDFYNYQPAGSLKIRFKPHRKHLLSIAMKYDEELPTLNNILSGTVISGIRSTYQGRSFKENLSSTSFSAAYAFGNLLSDFSVIFIGIYQKDHSFIGNQLVVSDSATTSNAVLLEGKNFFNLNGIVDYYFRHLSTNVKIKPSITSFTRPEIFNSENLRDIRLYSGQCELQLRTLLGSHLELSYGGGVFGSLMARNTVSLPFLQRVQYFATAYWTINERITAELMHDTYWVKNTDNSRSYTFLNNSVKYSLPNSSTSFSAGVNNLFNTMQSRNVILGSVVFSETTEQLIGRYFYLKFNVRY